MKLNFKIIYNYLFKPKGSDLFVFTLYIIIASFLTLLITLISIESKYIVIQTKFLIISVVMFYLPLILFVPYKTYQFSKNKKV